MVTEALGKALRASALSDDLAGMVRSQLPRALQDKLSVTIFSDAYHMGGVAVIRDQNKREWRTRLEVVDIEGVPVACMLPQWMIDHLCLAAV